MLLTDEFTVAPDGLRWWALLADHAEPIQRHLGEAQQSALSSRILLFGHPVSALCLATQRLLVPTLPIRPKTELQRAIGRRREAEARQYAQYIAHVLGCLAGSARAGPRLVAASEFARVRKAEFQ